MEELGRPAGDGRGRSAWGPSSRSGQPRPRTFIGEGKVAEVRELVGRWTRIW